MKVIKNGRQFTIHADDDIEIVDAIPVGTYNVNYNKITDSISLLKRSNMEINEKIYGAHDSKVRKVMNAYHLFERNLGVILSGPKGIGKSLFAKQLCINANAIGMPVIVVNDVTPGLAEFIESIEQQCLVLFDEFDKTFSVRGGTDVQAKLLSLFDGICIGKKMYVITCNYLRELNDFLINRPGRFHYHFRFDYPRADEIREFMTDHIAPQYYNVIDKVVEFATRINLNFDCLRALAFELNMGTPFQEAIDDLNIINNDNQVYMIEVGLESGRKLVNTRYVVNLYDESETFMVEMPDSKDNNVMDLVIPKNKLKYNSIANMSYVDPDHVQIQWAYDDDKDRERDYKNDKVVSFKMTTKLLNTYHYTV